MSLKKNLFNFRARLQPHPSLLQKCLMTAREVTGDAFIIRIGILITAFTLSFSSYAQTTIQTSASGYTGNGTGSASPGTGITFSVHNTNAYDVVLTQVGYSPHITTPIQLWYSSTSLTGGTGVISTPAWTQASQVSAATTVGNTVIVDNFFTGLSVVIPANTTYRFCCVSVGGTARYSAASGPPITTWTSGGVTLDASASLWGGSNNVSNSGRFFFGSITFMPSCINPTNLNISNISVNGASASWNGVTGSLGYEYAITTTPAPPGLGTPTLGTTASFTGLALNTTYYVHVRNKCASAYSNWITTSFTTLNAYCLPPTNILFSNITMTSVEILWSLMPTANYYQYIVDQVYTATPNPAQATTTTSINTSATNLLPYTKYYVYVRSFCLNGDDSSWWKVDSFVTKATCGTPSPQIIVPGNDPQVQWDIVLDAVAYEYRLTGSTHPPAFGTETKNLSVTVNLPNDGTNQYLHVRSKCNSQFTFSEWAKVTLRETNTTAINDVDRNGTIVSVYPNPVNDWATVEINSNHSIEKATLVLTDMAGSVIRTQAVTGKKMQVDMRGIASGTYFIRYSSTAHNEVMRVNKL